jgi:hypothetical protein
MGNSTAPAKPFLFIRGLVMDTYYCVSAEFYDNYDENGFVLFTEVKACVTERQAKEKPLNRSRQSPGMEYFKIWFEYKAIAEHFLSGIKSGEIKLFHPLQN